ERESLSHGQGLFNFLAKFGFVDRLDATRRIRPATRGLCKSYVTGDDEDLTPHHRSIVQPRGFRAFAVLVLMPLILAGSMAQVAPPDALEQARVLYNAGQYDEAIRLAAAASESPRWAQPAAVVIARSHLE